MQKASVFCVFIFLAWLGVGWGGVCKGLLPVGCAKRTVPALHTTPL
jgi:hypothetical protein